MIKEVHTSSLIDCRFFNTTITLLLQISIAFGFAPSAQNIRVSRTIPDQNGGGLSGAAVFVKGTNMVTSNDVNGYYSLIATSHGILFISFLGCQTIDHLVNGQPSHNLHLPEATLTLNEIIVTRYASQRRRDVTEAIVSNNPYVHDLSPQTPTSLVYTGTT